MTKPLALLLVFIVLYGVLLLQCVDRGKRDPTSFFFQPAKAYERKYSLKRQFEALELVQQANTTATGKIPAHSPTLCVGISTIRRDGNEQYVRATVGSLLQGLNSTEQADIHLAVLLANTDPARHPVWTEPWLTKLVDTRLTYSTKSTLNYAQLEGWEATRDFRAKAVFDYRHLLQHCSTTKAQYIVMVEDDTLAAAGWYGRLVTALPRLQRHEHWLYVRLFYTEEFLGWNVEEWPRYLFWSAAITSLVWGGLCLAQRKVTACRSIRNVHIATVCLLCIPACIILYFLAGRMTVQPLSSDLVPMNRYGCCGQALVFPWHMAPRINAELVARGSGYIDTMLEQIADELRLDRFALVPSVMQHVGSKSSKEDDTSVQAKSRATVAEKIWSFAFETYG